MLMVIMEYNVNDNCGILFMIIMEYTVNDKCGI